MIDKRNSITTVAGIGWMTDIGWADDTLGLGHFGDPKWMASEFQELEMMCSMTTVDGPGG